MLSRYLLPAAVAATGILACSCSAAPNRALGRIDGAEITAHGTASYPADKPKVFDACLGALKVLGYDIAVTQPEKGLIVTSRKEIAGFSRYDRGSQTAVHTGILQQYTLHVDVLGPAETRVVAVPSFFLNDRDVTGERLVLDGPGGVRSSWATLFNQIQMLL